MRAVAHRRAVREFPWEALEITALAVERRLRSARRALERSVVPHRLAESLAPVIGATVEIVVRGIDTREPAGHFTRLVFETPERDARCLVGVEPPLATALLAKLLGQRPPLVPAELALEPALLGALSALIVEAARATGAREPLRPAPVASLAEPVIVHATVILDGRPYAAALWFSPRWAREAGSSARLRDLGTLELALPLVIGVALATPGMLSALTRDAAFCPGSGLWVNATGEGRAALVAPTSSAAAFVEVLANGNLVLRERGTLDFTVSESNAMANEEPGDTPALEAAVLDAPLVVRIELGTVSMPARDWAELRPGDVIETRRRIGGPVVLRAGGRALAHGELVNIDGELGVRVTRLLPEGSE